MSNKYENLKIMCFVYYHRLDRVLNAGVNISIWHCFHSHALILYRKESVVKNKKQKTLKLQILNKIFIQ